MHLIGRMIALACTVLASGTASAQTYPNKAVTIVVSLAAGGAADVIARALAQRLTDQWGHPVLIENKGGANNQVGTAAVAKAAPDGYTLLLTPEHTFTVNPFLYRKLAYDPNELVPVTGVVSISQTLVAHPAQPMQSITDLVTLAKSRPGQLNYGSLGVGSGPHLSMELLQSMTGAKLTPVHYKGAAPALTDVIAGHIPMMFVSTGMIVQPWKSGKVRPLGAGTTVRIPQYPDLPTVAETLPGFTAIVWFGLFAPAGTPRDVVNKINESVQRILAESEFQARTLVPNVYGAMRGTPDEFAEHIRADSTRWRKVIEDARITAED